MTILLISASPHANGATKRALEECESVLNGHGVKTSYFYIGNEPRYACTACGKCKSGKGCVYADLDELKDAIKQSDGIIIGTPTHYGGAPGNLLALLSRLIFSAGSLIEYKPVAVIGAGRRGAVCTAISEILRFFEFKSCPLVTGGYPALIYGTDYDLAGFDAEGLQNMRSIAENMYWIASAIKIADKYGVSHPIAEPKIKTDISSLL